MKSVTFVAASTSAALQRVHAKLGPEAVILNVRRRSGAARLWHGADRVEITAGIPESNNGAQYTADTRAAHISDHLPFDADSGTGSLPEKWRSIAWLESMGLLSEFANELQDEISAAQGALPPRNLEQEWEWVHQALLNHWRNPPPLHDEPARPHVFVGPSGMGKTTIICKWLTLAVLTGERRAALWRLDGSQANTSEMLNLHGELLGVKVERFWSRPPPGSDLLLVDLPGVEAGDRAELTALAAQLAALPSPRIHLVLNAAYETSHLLHQARSFSSLQPEDIILTHLDEEEKRTKFWNLLFGTKCSLRFLSGGQKIPGFFSEALPELLFPS